MSLLSIFYILKSFSEVFASLNFTYYLHQRQAFKVFQLKSITKTFYNPSKTDFIRTPKRKNISSSVIALKE